MKRNDHRGGLFRLLAAHILLFTLTLLAITAAVFLAWDAALADLTRPPDWDALLASDALREGRYDALRRYPGRFGDLAVYGAHGALVWASADGFDARLTDGELELVRPYGELSAVETYAAQSGDGETRTLVLRRAYSDGGAETVQAMALDGAGRVVWGGLGDGRASYTEAELSYLTDTRFERARLMRASVAGADGARTVLLRERMPDDAEMLRRYGETRRVWLAFLPLYLADAGLFIWWLRRRIARPLRRLNDAVAAQAEGRGARVGDCGGPREIRRIAESFDRFAERLEASEAERRRLDGARQKMIADISHDIKTPVTVICAGIDAVCDGKLPPRDVPRALRGVRQPADTLARLVDTFHEYSKTQHPEFALRLEPLDVCEFAREYLAAKYDEISMAGFSLEPDIPDEPLVCLVDRVQFTRALDNLFSNALRHNRLGTMLFTDVAEENGAAVIRVADNGEGIPPARRAHIFEPFVTGDDARSAPGSGLGLAITRRIVEHHGGTVELAARPAPGRTTEFVLTLPLAPAARNEGSAAL